MEPTIVVPGNLQEEHEPDLTDPYAALVQAATPAQLRNLVCVLCHGDAENRRCVVEMLGQDLEVAAAVGDNDDDEHEDDDGDDDDKDDNVETDNDTQQANGAAEVGSRKRKRSQVMADSKKRRRAQVQEKTCKGCGLPYDPTENALGACEHFRYHPRKLHPFQCAPANPPSRLYAEDKGGG